MAYKIAVANIKGGIGKTTTALNLADQFLKRGKRVLMLDMDSQCNTSTVYRAATENVETMYDILFGGLTAQQCIQRTEYGDIIPNDALLKNADSQMRPGPGMYKYIKKALRPIEQDYDVVIFDTPPHNGVLLGNVLMCCDGVILPVECDVFSLKGIMDLNQTVLEFQEDNESLQILGILKVKHKKNHKLTKDIEETILLDAAKEMNTTVFDTTIRESVRCKEAATYRVRLSEYAPRSTVELDYSALVEELIKKGVPV